MYEKLDHCPACGHTLFKNRIICQDHAASKESFALVECAKCTLVFTNPRPDEQNIGKYYQHENYISHTNKANNLTNTLYKIIRNYTLSQKLSIVKRFSTKKRILDYGCGPGVFANKMIQSNYEVTGFEPSEEVDHSEYSNKIKFIKSFEALQKENKFDIITAWHVIEHVHRLKPTIKSLRKLLESDGLFIIAVPNINSYDAEHYKEKWAAYDVPRHLYHFSQTSINSLLIKNKFELLETLPMKFDSFYVSLLSEKYSNSNGSLLKAFKTGLQSNRKAKSTGEYSSLIYVYQKK